VSVRIEVVESADAARAICQTAERVGAKVVCLGSSGLPRVADAVLGSVSSRVVHECAVPLLLVQPMKE
jgi:nucleotide-binding universal stress UspA family protein